jgi:signal transduction histidine kinase
MSQRTILFVDDEANILSALLRSLRREDVRILTAPSAREALAILDREPVAVIVSDEKMPEMGGAELLARVKEKHPDTVRILLTGLRDVETAQKAINTGECYRFLTKPWNDSDLRLTIRAALEKFDLTAENRRLERLTELQNRELAAWNADLERKVAERTQQLIQSKKMAAIGLLAGGVAHEMNNPVAGILALTQLLMKEAADPKLLEDLRKIEGLAYRCIDVVQDILDFSRQSKTDQRELADMNVVIDRSLTFVSLYSKQFGVDIRREPARGLPKARIHLNQMQQVLLNLLTNACQAMPGGGRIVIATRHDDARDRVELSVADTGSGIPPEALGRIFEPFFSRKSEGKGTGLGLSICYRIVREHGGEIRVESAPGRGSLFTVAIPAAR